MDRVPPIFIPREESRYPAKPGEWRFLGLDYKPCDPPKPGEAAQLDFACPAGRGYCGPILIGHGFKPTGNRPSWAWNGSLADPQLDPSIDCRTHTATGEEAAGCGWHAWLTAASTGKPGGFGPR